MAEELPEHVRRNRTQCSAAGRHTYRRGWPAAAPGRCGLEIEGLLEIRPADGSTTRYPFMTLEWAQRWPCEEVWKARKRGE